MIAVYTITLLVSSTLLFLVQPMFARMALPLLGGSPGVWNTCMVFFQACLLAGYLYAHLSTQWLGVRRQTMLHALLLLAPLVVLPISISSHWIPDGQINPTLWLLLLLGATVGLPFFVIAASAPLLQKWFSTLGHRDSHDPYFLYAASNVGSMTALLAYPLLFEPLMTLRQQNDVWMYGYVMLGLLTIGCAWTVLRHARQLNVSADIHVKTKLIGTDAVHWTRRVRWIALAAVPSSLLLGVTSYITTDVAVTPLLWVVPLALYLLTFIMVFARRRLIPQIVARRMVPFAAILLLLLLLIEATEPLAVVMGGHIVAFFVLALALHGELADDRPSTRDLTSFYLMMGLGGMLGGMFNAIIAPYVFTTVAEYPLAIAAAAAMLFRPRTAGIGRIGAADVLWPLLVGALTLAMIALADARSMELTPARFILTAAVPALACFVLSRKPLRFGFALAAVFAASTVDTINRGSVIGAYRGFFGVHRVTYVDGYHRLYHGTTLHGMQRVDADRRKPTKPLEPLAYYHTDGPAGRLLARFNEAGRSERVGLVGLGVGAMVAYAHPGQHFTYYEIDPLVVSIAADTRYFTYLDAAKQRGVQLQVQLGDGRLLLERAERAGLDILVLDAFSSDAIPVHLLTREAFATYWHAMSEQGVILMHISNRYFDLEPVLGNLAADGGFVCKIYDDSLVSLDQMQRDGRKGSRWAVMAHHEDDLAILDDGRPWHDARQNPDQAVWRDDYVNVLGALIFEW